MAACVVDLLWWSQYQALEASLPKIVGMLSKLIWWALWKPHCNQIGAIGDNPSGVPASCTCVVCMQVSEQVSTEVEMALPVVATSHFLHEAVTGNGPIFGGSRPSLYPVPLPVWFFFGHTLHAFNMST